MADQPAPVMRAYVTGAPLRPDLARAAVRLVTGHHPELDEPLEDLPGGQCARYRQLSARQFASRNPRLCLWVASTRGGRAGRLCAEAMAMRAGAWPR